LCKEGESFRKRSLVLTPSTYTHLYKHFTDGREERENREGGWRIERESSKVE
jgi:hypothetical protein